MAYQTVFLLRFQHRMWIVFLSQRVESRPGFGIDGRDLNELPMIDPAYIDIIAEIDCPRRFRCDLGELKAGFCKDQGLGGDGNLEML